jgi:protoporphyrinogen oxidase
MRMDGVYMTREDEPECGRCVIIGAGPAGLTAAYELALMGVASVVLEQDGVVGGIARTVEHHGYRFDIGGHRFFTRSPLIAAWWEQILKEDFQTCSRLSRIYYNGKFFDYPLRPLNALRGLGPVETLRIVASYAKARLLPYPKEHTFEEWVCNRFGRRLFEIFFKTYTEKVWGMKCSEIGADWASQRIKNLDLVAAAKDMMTSGNGDITTLIRQFRYPRLGPGMMWERVAGILDERGIPLHLDHRVTKVHLGEGSVTAVTAVDNDGRDVRFAGEHFISSMPIKDLIAAMSPPPPDSVVAAANSLRYRDFLTVGLVIDKPELFKDNWIYIHSPDVKVGRIQNFKNWSPDMVPDPSRTSLGLEFFIQEGDELWNAGDEVLIDLATRECVQLGFIEEQDVVEGVVIRMPKAYPVYDDQYKARLARIRDYLRSIANLQLVGRNGQHRYNNQDHSMLTAIYAAHNVAGAEFDIWDVNLQADYHEGEEEGREGVTERLVPQRKSAP